MNVMRIPGVIYEGTMTYEVTMTYQVTMTLNLSNLAKCRMIFAVSETFIQPPTVIYSRHTIWIDVTMIVIRIPGVI